MKPHRPGQQVCILLGMGSAMDDVLTIGITDLHFFHLDRERLSTPDIVFTTHVFIHSLQSFMPLLNLCKVRWKATQPGSQRNAQRSESGRCCIHYLFSSGDKQTSQGPQTHISDSRCLPGALKAC